jgi:hypothetical protein
MLEVSSATGLTHIDMFDDLPSDSLWVFKSLFDVVDRSGISKLNWLNKRKWKPAKLALLEIPQPTLCPSIL